MIQKIKKSLVTITIISFVLAMAFALALPVSVNAGTNLLWGNQEGNISNTIGLGSRDPRLIAASVINVILGFLGIIAVVIILVGGFKWMTAGGNEDKVGEAKKMITAGVIGLIIILASWGLATFVVNLLYNATQ